jgi:hypothetical protein
VNGAHPGFDGERVGVQHVERPVVHHFDPGQLARTKVSGRPIWPASVPCVGTMTAWMNV